MDMLQRINKTAWSIAQRIPYARAILHVTNTYVWNGNILSLSRFAPLSLYFKKIFLKVALIFSAATAIIYFGQKYSLLKAGELNLFATSLGIFPSILGFGVGAYALLFTFPSSFFEHLERRASTASTKVGAHGLNAIVAFPLLLISIIMLLAASLQTIQLDPLTANSVGLGLIWYGLLSTIEVIAVLFASARKVIRNTKVNISAQADPERTENQGQPHS